jgi:WD40 repeat protein
MIELPKLPWPKEPYRGIEQFRFIDRPIFFERREETRRLIRLVSIYRGALVYGESGTGKSSVINAGFIPAMLDEGFLPERLRVQPIEGAELVVERIPLADENVAPFLPSRFASDDESRLRLVFSTSDVHSRIATQHPAGIPLLIFDQFEEFITLFEEAPENRQKLAEATRAQKTLLDFFHELLRSEVLPVKLLFVFREDYLAKLSKLFALVPNLRDQNVRLTFPDSSVLKTLIRGPFTLSEIPPVHFGHAISEDVANKLCHALDERSEGGAINLTEVQIACLSLWRDPKMESLFNAPQNLGEAVRRLLEGHLTGALDRLGPGLREPAVAILRHLVTSAGTRNIVLEADLLERLQTCENVSPSVGKRAIAELSGESHLIRRQRRNEAYFYDITSEFLVPWIQRQRALSDARTAMRRWRKKVAIAVACVLGPVLLVAGAAVYLTQEKRKDEREKALVREQDITRQKVELEKFVALEQRSKLGEEDVTQQAIDSITNKEDVKKETVPGPEEPLPPGVEAPAPGPADSSGAAEYVTDKLFIGHTGTVWSARYSAPGLALALPGETARSFAFVITAGHDQTARAWDLRSDDDFILSGHRGEVNYAMFNPKPSTDATQWLAATASDDGTAALWRASEPTKPHFLTGHGGPVTGLAWSKDGNWLVTTSKDKKAFIWNLSALDKPPISLAKHTGDVWLPALIEAGPKKSFLVTPSSDGTARLWNFPDGSSCTFSRHDEKDRDVLRHGSPIRRVGMDSQARWIVTAGADGRAILWDRSTGQMLLVVKHDKAVRDVSFKPGTGLFVTASADNTAQVWDAEKMEGVVTLAGHTAPLFSARFTPYGPGVVTVSWDRTARLWNYETKKCVAILKGHLGSLWSVEFSPTGTNFTTTSGDSTARLWDLKSIPGGAAFLPPASAK